MNFDMHRIGQTIARLRREQNMTQMQLADEMSVSFQAVSNWERGQSMPDISKLPELAELLGTTIDELLGRSSPLIEKAAENRLDELPVLDAEELAEAAPLLPPRQMDELTDRLLELPNLPDMTELLPFLSTKRVDELLRQRAEKGESIAEYIPFSSTALVEEIALQWEKQGKSIVQLVPFMHQSAIDRIVRERERNSADVIPFAPFLSQQVLHEIVFSRLQAGRSVKGLLPFVGQDLLEQLLRTASSRD